MPNDRLVPISLKLEVVLLDRVEAFCIANGEARSSFVRRACVRAMEGPVVASNAQ